MALISPALKGNAVLRQIESKTRKGLAMGRSTNDTGAVKLIQEALKTLGEDLGGDWVPPSSGLGWYGQHTVNAVISFQVKAWPTSSAEWDGVVGQKTLWAIDSRLAGGAPTPHDDVQPPPGVLPTEQDWLTLSLEPPLFYCVGIKLSYVDPLLLPVIASVFSNFGISIPNGGDLIFGLMRRMGKVRDLASLMASGGIFGTTPRRSALPLTLPTVIAWAKRYGAGTQLVQILERVAAIVPTSAALSAGLVGILAVGFNDVGEMNNRVSGLEDEATFNFAVGNTKGLGKLLKVAVENAGHLSDLINASGSVYDSIRNLGEIKQRSIVVMDIPLLSIGVDIGFSASRTKFYSLDFDALLRNLDPSQLIMGVRAPSSPRLVSPYRGVMTVRRPI